MDESRRTFLAGVAGAGASALWGEALAQAKPAAAPAAAPAGTIPNDAIKKQKVPAMQYHSERPITGSVLAHEHDFDVTPTDRMFVRNNLLTPDIDVNAHRLAVKGLVDKELNFSVAELQKRPFLSSPSKACSNAPARAVPITSRKRAARPGCRPAVWAARNGPASASPTS